MTIGDGEGSRLDQYDQRLQHVESTLTTMAEGQGVISATLNANNSTLDRISHSVERLGSQVNRREPAFPVWSAGALVVVLLTTLGAFTATLLNLTITPVDARQSAFMLEQESTNSVLVKRIVDHSDIISNERVSAKEVRVNQEWLMSRDKRNEVLVDDIYQRIRNVTYEAYVEERRRREAALQTRRDGKPQ
jgi:hypothetical protein